MKELLKQAVNGFLSNFNLRLSYFDRSRPRYVKATQSLGVNLIFDIGANNGQFALSILEHGFQGEIISFEPTSQAYEQLKKKAKKFPNWKIHERAAVGEKCGNVTINIAGNSAASSSILAMGKAHEEADPKANFIGSETVKLITLDSVFKNYVSSRSKCLLKIDVQGYEEHVLQGAAESIQRVDVVKLECSLVSLYEGDKTFEFYFDFFEKRGFKLFDVETGFSNPVTGQLLQFDALFVRG